MSFTTFLFYFICSQIVYMALAMGFLYLHKKYVKYKFTKAVRNGDIKVIRMEDLPKKENDDGTWH